MSTEVVAAVIGASAGGLFGLIAALLSLLVERQLRQGGKLECVTDSFRIAVLDPTHKGSEITGDIYWNPVDITSASSLPTYVNDVDKFQYTFRISIFNEKDVSTGLRDVRVVFYQGNNERMSSKPRARETSNVIEVINCPSREWVTVTLSRGVVDKQGLESLRDCDKVVFQGILPTGVEFKCPVSDLLWP